MIPPRRKKKMWRLKMNFTTDIFFAAKPAKKLYGVSGLSEVYIETIYLLVISSWLETDHWTLSGPNVLNDSL
jgi:hypothetical protein